MNIALKITLILAVAAYFCLPDDAKEDQRPKLPSLTLDKSVKHDVQQDFSTVGLICNCRVKSSMRLEAVKSLGANLTPVEILQLCEFLKGLPDLQYETLPASQLLKNNLLNALMDQSFRPSQLTGLMVGIYHDTRQDLVTRDYVLQHLITWYEQSPIDNEKTQIRETLKQALAESNSLAGTSLLGMYRLSSDDAMFNRNEIKKNALSLAADSQNLDCRITAIQVCAEEGALEALPLIRSLVKSQESIALRISVIAALGRLGELQDTAILRQLEDEHSVEMGTAIKVAERKLRERYQTEKVAVNLN